MPAVIEVSTSSKPGWKVGSLAVSAAVAVRWAPAEAPTRKMVSGSAPYSMTVGADPGDELLDVDEVAGEGVGWRGEVVVGADAGPALAGEVVEERAGLAVLAPPMEPAAVQVDECRRARRVGAVTVDVEQVGRAIVAVGDVRQPLDVASPEHPRQRTGSSPTASAGAAHRRARDRVRSAIVGPGRRPMPARRPVRSAGSDARRRSDRPMSTRPRRVRATDLARRDSRRGGSAGWTR